jgi:hypothetical protein
LTYLLGPVVERSEDVTRAVGQALAGAGTPDPVLAWLLASSWAGASASRAIVDAMGRALAAALLAEPRPSGG